MNYIKVKNKSGGLTYFTPGSNFLFTSDGRAYGYLSDRGGPLELDTETFTPARYDAVIMYQNKNGWFPLVDMTQRGRIIYTNASEETQVVLDPGEAEITEAGQATDGLTANLAAAGFQVKAPQ